MKAEHFFSWEVLLVIFEEQIFSRQCLHSNNYRYVGFFYVINVAEVTSWSYLNPVN